MDKDQSIAFDNIKRKVIINLLKVAGGNEDEIRLVKCLITNTKLMVKINNFIPETF